jgi:hypothetical protein
VEVAAAPFQQIEFTFAAQPGQYFWTLSQMLPALGFAQLYFGMNFSTPLEFHVSMDILFIDQCQLWLVIKRQFRKLPKFTTNLSLS